MFILVQSGKPGPDTESPTHHFNVIYVFAKVTLESEITCRSVVSKAERQTHHMNVILKCTDHMENWISLFAIAEWS